MTPPFTSLLVANRGEIACRIFRTARAMGIRAIAVYSDADAKAKHVREADEAVHIGASAASNSYLRGDKVLAAAKAAGAAAIHPGYGFLSENPEFAEAVVAAGLIWVGPTPASIRAMGLKDEAKRIAIAAGVPVLAGYQGEDQSEKRLLDEAKTIGFPVLIKAVAGGGGRGIREVKAAKEFRDQLVSAQREAKAAFGDERVLIEKLVERPRHIEVQVFGDKHGGLVHLFERDCSLQRRRQKVIEEAPAPGMTDEVRAAMTEAALKVARAVKYENAGTIEFIVDGNGPLRPDGFWFLEMNTRLQVEHPVTEAITGLDLVEWQLRVAAGEQLPKAQDEIALRGHAMEARICAEDPAEGFRPSVGLIRTLGLMPETPADRDRLMSTMKKGAFRDFIEASEYQDAAIRIDSGYDDNDTVPSAYDNLVAKMIAFDGDRPECIQRLSTWLESSYLSGIRGNIGFLSRCIQTPEFASGQLHTGIIAERIDTLSDRSVARREAIGLLSQFPLFDTESAVSSPWSNRDGWRLNAAPRLERWFELEGEVIKIESSEQGLGWSVGASSIICDDGHVEVFTLGETFEFWPPGARVDQDGGLGGDDVKAPLPGKIVAFTAKVGASVKKGEALVTLEAMKMEHALKAPRDGVVAEVGAEEGAQVKEGAVLVRLEPAA